MSQWVQGIDYAIANKFNLIDLLAGSDPRFLEPQVKAARDAGAIVVAAHLTGFEQAVPGGASAVVPIDYKTAGALLADWAVGKTDGKVNAVVLVSNEALSTDSMVSGIKEVFGGCPDCKYNIVNIPIPEWATKIQPNVQSALLADRRSTTSSRSTIDGPVRGAGADITGKSDSVKIVTFNGTPFAIGMIQQGQVEMDVGENLDWIAHWHHRCRDAHALRPADGEGPEDPALYLRRLECRDRRAPPAGQYRLRRRLCRGLQEAVEAPIGGDPTMTGAPEPAPVLRIEAFSKHFGGARALDNVSTRGRPRRGPRPPRPERLGQVDPDQDPRRLP